MDELGELIDTDATTAISIEHVEKVVALVGSEIGIKLLDEGQEFVGGQLIVTIGVEIGNDVLYVKVFTVDLMDQVLHYFITSGLNEMSIRGLLFVKVGMEYLVELFVTDHTIIIGVKVLENLVAHLCLAVAIDYLDDSGEFIGI